MNQRSQYIGYSNPSGLELPPNYIQPPAQRIQQAPLNPHAQSVQNQKYYQHGMHLVQQGNPQRVFHPRPMIRRQGDNSEPGTLHSQNQIRPYQALPAQAPPNNQLVQQQYIPQPQAPQNNQYQQVVYPQAGNQNQQFQQQNQVYQPQPQYQAQPQYQQPPAQNNYHDQELGEDEHYEEDYVNDPQVDQAALQAGQNQQYQAAPAPAYQPQPAIPPPPPKRNLEELVMLWMEQSTKQITELQNQVARLTLAVTENCIAKTEEVLPITTLRSGIVIVNKVENTIADKVGEGDEPAKEESMAEEKSEQARFMDDAGEEQFIENYEEEHGDGGIFEDIVDENGYYVKEEIAPVDSLLYPVLLVKPDIGEITSPKAAKLGKVEVGKKEMKLNEEKEGRCEPSKKPPPKRDKKTKLEGAVRGGMVSQRNKEGIAKKDQIMKFTPQRDKSCRLLGHSSGMKFGSPIGSYDPG